MEVRYNILFGIQFGISIKNDDGKIQINIYYNIFSFYLSSYVKTARIKFTFGGGFVLSTIIYIIPKCRSPPHISSVKIFTIK